MTAAFLSLLQSGLIATSAALVLALLLRVWRIPARVEHVLWLLVAVRFILPPIVKLPLPGMIGGLAPAVATVGVGATGSPASGAPGPRSSQLSPGGGLREPATGILSDVPRRTAVAGQVVKSLLVLWAAGAVFTLGRQGVRLRRWTRARRLRPAPPRLAGMVVDVARTIGTRAPRLAVDDALETPVVTGLLRPRLLWPARDATGVRAATARTLIAHELMHIRRGDLWVGLLEAAGRCVWWWFPGWMFVERRLHDAAERACDEAVVAHYPSLRHAYAEGLLDVAAGVAAPGPAGALGLGGSGRRLRRRIRDVLSAERPQLRPTGVVGALLFACATLPAWSVAAPMPGSSGTGQVAGLADPVLSALARAARDTDPNVRRAAANALRDLRVYGAAEALERLSTDRDEAVRRAARVALGLEAPSPNKSFPPDPPVVLPSSSIAAWVSALEAADFHERQSAIDALANGAVREAAPAILPLLRDPHPRVRQSAAAAFASIHFAPAIPSLTERVRDEDSNVRQNAASALGHYADPRSVSALTAALEDVDTHVRQVATSALGRIAATRAR